MFIYSVSTIPRSLYSSHITRGYTLTCITTKHNPGSNVYLLNVRKTTWNIDGGKEVDTSFATHLLVSMLFFLFSFFGEWNMSMDTWGQIVFIMLPKQMSSICCLEDSEVIAHIASEDTGGISAKPLYP